MSTFDMEALLQDVAPDSPCGPNLEYDPAFLALELAILGKPEVQYGKTITPAVPPEWKDVKRLASELLARSRDLRVALPLLRAMLALSGVAGFTAGITLVERLLEQRWDSVHPQLDPDDDLDPSLRINSLATLADAATIVREVKAAAIITLPGLGPFSLRDLEITMGEIPAPDGTKKVALASIEAALLDVEFEHLRSALANIQQAHDSAVNIEAVLVRHVGSAQALNLSLLTRALRRGCELLSASFKARSVDVEAEVEVEVQAPAGQAAVAGPVAAGKAAPAGISGEIGDRKDVLLMLDKICKYYQQFEPSSPVPVLLMRVKRLVPKSFLEIMQDLAPDGLSQMAVISGPPDPSDDQ